MVRLGRHQNTMPTRTESIALRTSGPSTSGDRLEMEGRTWGRSLRGVLKNFNEDRCSLIAGSLAYHGLLALFPTVIALLGIVVLLHLDATGVTKLVHAVDKTLPPGAASVLTAAVKAATTQASGSVGA